MIDTWRLVRAKSWIMRNRFSRPGRADRFKSLFFFSLTLGFQVGLFFGATALFQRLAAEEPFGSILVGKLVEFLFITFFTVLTFSSIITSLNAFFLDADLPMLITAPTTWGRLYLARFAQAFGMTGWMMILVGLPIFVALGLVFHAPAYFYPWMLAVMVVFLLVPIALGSLITIVLVKAFPARKMQDILILIAVVLIVMLYFLFRFLRPEQLFNPDIFHGFAEYFATLQTPDSPLLPSSWGATALMAPLHGRMREDGLGFLLLSLSWGLMLVTIGTSVAKRTFLDAYTKSQEGRRLTVTGLPFVQAIFEAMTRGRDPVNRQFFLKEIRTFFRDTAQWTQLLLLMSLIVVYLFNFKALDLDRFSGITFQLRNIIAYMNLILAGFVLSAICVRFVLPAVSLEGEAFWIVKAAPVSMNRFVWNKFKFYAPPVFIVSEMLVVLSNIFLRSTPFIMGVSAALMGLLSLSITALAIGVGAIYPNFEEKNVAKVATSVSSIIYMVASLGLVVVVVSIMAYPARIAQRALLDEAPLASTQWAIIGLSIGVVLTMIAASVLWPIRRGIRALETRED